MAAPSQEQLDCAIHETVRNQDQVESMYRASDAVRIAKIILITHRVQGFTGSDVVALAGLILEGAHNDAR